MIAYPDIEFLGAWSVHERALVIRTARRFWRVFWRFKESRREMRKVRALRVGWLRPHEEETMDGRFLISMSTSRVFEFRICRCDDRTLVRTVVHELLHGMFLLDDVMQKVFAGTCNVEEAIVVLASEEVLRRFKRS